MLKQLMHIKTESNILYFADYLQNEILSNNDNLPELNWPPTINELASQERNPPESLITFLTHLLRSEKHLLTSENLCCSVICSGFDSWCNKGWRYNFFQASCNSERKNCLLMSIQTSLEHC